MTPGRVISLVFFGLLMTTAPAAGVFEPTASRDVTPLEIAAANCDTPTVATLIQAGAAVNHAAKNGATPLMVAAECGSAAVVKPLLDAGADVNATEAVRSQTALMFAAASGNAAVVRLLAARGADLSAATNVVKLERPRFDEDGNPIAPAAAPAKTDGTRRRNATLGGFARVTSATVSGGMTALLIAARDGHLDAVKALVESGAAVNQVSGGEHASPLVIAICNGHYDVAAYLLDHGADPRLTTIDGLTALYAAIDTEWAQVGWAPNPITSEEKVSYLELMKCLLAHGADPNARLTNNLWFRPTSHNQEWVDKKGVTAFWRAAQSSDVAAMKMLVSGGADPRIATLEGVTPLMVAAGLGWGANATRNVPDSWSAAVKFCLELGLDVNARDTYGYTALHGAAYRGDSELVRLLVTSGAKLDPRSKRGQSVTDMANGPVVNAHLPMEHPDTVALLVSLGAPQPGVQGENN